MLVVGLRYLIFNPEALGLWGDGPIWFRTASVHREACLFRHGVQVIAVVVHFDRNRGVLMVVPAQSFDHQTSEVKVL